MMRRVQRLCMGHVPQLGPGTGFEMNEDARHFVGRYSHPYLLTMAPC
jgi:hypothetical protein